MLYIILAVIMFGLLIAIHEFGHFIVAKACGIKVLEFAIGMGPLLLKKQGKETQYSIRLFPIGGFCAMEGEEEASDDTRAFNNAAKWKQFLVLIAGSAFNFIAGLLILLFLYSNITAYGTSTITGFMEGFPCQGEEMLMEGDEILSINGKAVLLSSDISTLLGLSNGEPVDMVVRRDGAKVKLYDLPLTLREYEEDGQTIWRYGFYFDVKEVNFADRIRYGVFSAVDDVRMVFWSLEMLVGGQAGIQDLSGPVGIVNTMSEVGEQSPDFWSAVLNLLNFASFIAINLSVMNLLPLPALDGGKLFFLILNSILMLVIRRQIPERYEQYVHAAGMLLLLGLMAFIAFQDIFKIILQ